MKIGIVGMGSVGSSVTISTLHSRRLARQCSMDKSNSADDGTHSQIVFWHRDLPPLDAELVAEHTVEATSGRVAGTLSHRDELWDRCYQELMSSVHARLADEIARFGGHYAHVHDESIDTRHDS